MGDTTDAPGATGSKLEKILALVPRTLSSDAHIVFLGGCLGIYLVALALLGVNSDLGAFIAAGLTVHLARRHSGRTAQLQALFHKLSGRHEILEQGIERAEAANPGRHTD